jgi:uncharacterized cupin superfamily protein
MAMSELITTGHLDATDFEPLSAEEGGWVTIEGDPDVRVHTLCDNGEVWAGIGLLEPSTFEYPIEHPSAIQVLEGEATVSVDNRTVELGPGAIVVLKTGATSTWVVKSPLRQFFIVSTVEDAL